MKHRHPGAARRRRRANRHRRIALTAFCCALVAMILAFGIYIARWYVNLNRIQTEGARYAGLYGGRIAQAPGTDVSPSPTLRVTDTPTPENTASPSPTPRVTDTPSPTPENTASPSPSPEAAESPSPGISRAPRAFPDAGGATALPGADMPVVRDEPIPTPDADTLVYALPTPPPVQSTFAGLLALNPETVGFLDIGDMLSLPVVQRENDNEYYLSHSFEGEEASEGTLFMDGVNRLVPEDDCLIVYGHNMKNRSMFGRLSAYGGLSFLRQHSVIRFDTLYENRSYVVFAAFSASMDPRDSRYFDVRRFIFDENEFDKFVLKLQSRSVYRSPIEVRYGDGLLLLVTCDYSNREGRFILALRRLRADETEADLWAQAMLTEAK